MIVGGGFAGFAATHGMRDLDVDITLIDQHNFHVFTPLIYQVATAVVDPSGIAHPIRTTLRGLKHADFRLGRVTEIDVESREVHTAHGAIPYDYLVLAAGSNNNYFKHPEIAEASFGINDVGEAVALRNHLLQCVEQADWQSDPVERRRLLTFVIVGGGPTGVEFAGSLAELIYGILPRDFPWLDLAEARIHLIEGSDAPLPPFHPRLQKAAALALAKRGVTVTKGLVDAVESQDENHPEDGAPIPTHVKVKLTDGTEIEAGTVVWAAGVRAEKLAEGIGTRLGTQARLPVSSTLQLSEHPEVLAVGDMAEILQDGEALPMLATVAMQSGAHAARVITDLLSGRQPRPFRYRAYPTMATIGRGDAVVQSGRFRAAGRTGWLLWLAVHIGRVAGIRARLSVAVDWTAAFAMRDRPVRLIIRPRRPDIDR